MTKALLPEIKKAKEIERLRTENKELRELNKHLLQDEGSSDRVIEELHNLLKINKTPFNVTINPSTTANKAKDNHSEIACLMLSDWHVSEVISEQETNYSNKYNSLIAANRIAKLADSTKQIINFHKQAYNIEKLWIPVLGDFLSGNHVPDLKFNNDLEDSAASILVARLFQLLLLDLKSLNMPIELDCLVGNHGRFSSKLPSKRVAYDTWDYVIYEILSNYFQNDPQIKINIHPGHIVPVKQFNHKYILMHGTDLKISKLNEIEKTIMTLFDGRAYRNYSKETGPSYDMILLGHFHKSVIRDKMIINSSLSGQSELGLAWKLPALTGASQTLFGMSRKHPKTWLYNLNVDSIRNEKPSNTYSKYAKQFMCKHKRF